MNKEGNELIAKNLVERLTAFYENVRGCQLYENSPEMSYKCFCESFENFPYYGDNLYNLIYLSYQLQDWSKTIEYIRFVRQNDILHPALHQLVEMIKEQIR
ncbi:hypothetical protein [Brevibacillus sp. AY1]|uniref:hypothetical protein n=1 Tax=Brevibacillus sp. AY1 TaxID=2807621 RepID=UPI002454AF7D|nr:hypothetical protein [Brevibacillus sp. AY1]MDH4618269.1 hypothetical protein [Brevibacillus sp. AY1]